MSGTRGTRTRIATGIYKDKYGLSAIVSGSGHRQELRYRHDTQISVIRRDMADAKLRLGRLPRTSRGTLAEDAPRYLATVKPTLVSYTDRARHLTAWLETCGHLRTSTLHRHVAVLNQHLGGWRETLSASSCNQRRDAILNIVKILHGTRAARELGDDLIRFRRPPPEPRWIDRDLITRVLDQIRPTKTRARLQLLHWTGMRPSQMGRLSEASFRLADDPPWVVVPRGKGGRLAAVPLVPEGLAAADAFLAHQAFGPWDTDSANDRLQRVCALLDVPRFTLYTIRHSFASGLRQSGSDLRLVQELYGHTNQETTAIYAPPTLRLHYQAISRLR